MPKLKVFRTPIGFHDAYVAAPSQKAALAAWGSDADLFARGMAELVTEPDLTAEPLARPGEVIRRLRGSAEEQLAALRPDSSKRKPKAPTATAPAPRPDRAAVEAAERALADTQARQQEEERVLAAEEAELAERRRRLRLSHAAERERLEAERDGAEIAYADALRQWRAGDPASGG
jgi:hypothetical protein